MSDPASWPSSDELARRVGENFAARRGSHLERLKPAVALAERLAPLPLSHDVTKLQPPFFFEFSWTEMLGGLYVSPQSAEISARLCQAAAAVPFAGDLGLKALDKYAGLQPPRDTPRQVAFLPGSNILQKALSYEALIRAMHDEPELMIKPHPMTDAATLRSLGRAYGYHRIVDAEVSGAELLLGCETAYVCPTTELGLYGALYGKRLVNIGNVRAEAQGAYNGFYVQIWRDPSALRRMLACGLAGWFDPEDPALDAKIADFFALAMQLREAFRPLVREISPTDYADFLAGRFIRAPQTAA